MAYAMRNGWAASKSLYRASVTGNRHGISVLELLLVLILMGLAAATVTPAYLASINNSGRIECSLRLAVMQDAKKEVLEEMNRILPSHQRIRITDKLNPLHRDMIARHTLNSPWRFHPEDYHPVCGHFSLGETFLDVPTCEAGISVVSWAEVEAMVGAAEAKVDSPALQESSVNESLTGTGK